MTGWKILILALLAVAPLQGQTAERLRMARAYEQSGDLRSAARIYLEVYDGGAQSNEVFEGVARSLVGLRQYASLLPIVEQRYATQPSPSLAALAASLHARTGDLKGADQWWTTAIESDGGSERVYAMIGKDQTDLLLSERAVRSYEQARAAAADPRSYAAELSALYGATGAAEKAAVEILNLYRADRQLGTVYGRLSALLTGPEPTQAVQRVLERSDDSLPDLLEIRTWFYRETDQWDRAYQTVVEQDAQRQQRGADILRFATSARMAGKYDVALTAFGSLLKADRQVALAAAYGYARTLDQQMAESSMIDAATARSIIQRYREIIDTYPDHPMTAEAAVRAAQLYDRVLNEQEPARDLLTYATNRWRGTSAAAEGLLLLSELYLAAGRADAATDLLQQLIDSAPADQVDQRDQAALLLADLELFSGRIEPARARYLGLAADPRSVAANDALERLGLLIHWQEDSAGVSGYVQGLQALRERRRSDAARIFAAAATDARDPEVKDRCLFASATAYANLGQWADAATQIEPVIARIPESIYGDRALVLTANILERQGDVDGAISALTTLLVQYPRSVLAPEVRERIRRLRGDA